MTDGATMQYDRDTPDEFDESNLELYKEQSESLLKSLKKIFVACLNHLPREFVMSILKEKKFVEQDWSKNGNKYVERKNE